MIEGWDGPDGYSSERSFEIIQEQYILEMLNGRKITHFYSSEFYGDHVSRALGAVDRRVDEARNIVPVSGTKIRENPYQYRQYISDIVYPDLITKVVFVGAMSTGKSTLTEALAKRYDTTFASEYGRDYWTEYQVDRRITLEAFDEIAVGHIEREDDIPYDDTWDRSGDQKRKVFHKQIIADLRERRIPYISLTGSLTERMQKVDQVLAGFNKYSNYFGNKI